jgi:hypothetical protein
MGREKGKVLVGIWGQGSGGRLPWDPAVGNSFVLCPMKKHQCIGKQVHVASSVRDHQVQRDLGERIRLAPTAGRPGNGNSPAGRVSH